MVESSSVQQNLLQPQILYDSTKNEYQVKLRSPINIALVKYWGKAHEELIIPTNNSLSLTINKAQLCSTTTVTLQQRSADESGTEEEEPKISLKINGDEQKVSERIQRVVKAIRMRASEQLKSDPARKVDVKACQSNLTSRTDQTNLVTSSIQVS